MGGSSKSENVTQNKSSQSAINDNEGIAVSQVEGNVSIDVLDEGAINNSFEFAKETQAFLGETFSSVLGLIEKQQDDIVDVATASTDKVASAYASKQSGGLAPLAMGALGLLGFVGLIVAIKNR